MQYLLYEQSLVVSGERRGFIVALVGLLSSSFAACPHTESCEALARSDSKACEALSCLDSSAQLFHGSADGAGRSPGGGSLGRAVPPPWSRPPPPLPQPFPSPAGAAVSASAARPQAPPPESPPEFPPP